MDKTIKKELCVFGDIRSSKHFEASLAVLSKVHHLSRHMDSRSAIVVVDFEEHNQLNLSYDDNACMTMDSVAAVCFQHGADIFYQLKYPAGYSGDPRLLPHILSGFVETHLPKAFLFALSDHGREVAAMTACLNHSGLIAECIDLRFDEQGIVATCPAWNGEVMAELAFASNDQTGFLTVHPNAFEIEKIEIENGEVRQVNIAENIFSDQIEFVSSTPEPSPINDLENAKRVVVGGAGLGSLDAFRMVREFAVAINGEVGATRPPVLQHWVEEDRLIGQTGKTVKPEILFSIGTSGAVQYTAGIPDAKKIIAINNDPRAAIFSVADIGIVADAKDILPLLIQKANEIVMKNMAYAVCDDKEVSRKKGFGEKLRQMREANQWNQETLARSTGQSPDFIDQVEKGEITPSVAFLLRLSRALKVDPGLFLGDEQKAALKDRRTQTFVKRTQNYNYQTLTPDCEDEHLRAFIITIEPKQAHKPVEYKHEGEEFIYVLAGELELTLKGKDHILKPSESYHFNSEIPHKLKSLSIEPTQCLVALYTP